MKSEKVILKAFGSNIQEIRELGIGHFGKVILAETVGLSQKDLRLSESDDDKSKSTLVAVKELKSEYILHKCAYYSVDTLCNMMYTAYHKGLICVICNSYGHAWVTNSSV